MLLLVLLPCLNQTMPRHTFERRRREEGRREIGASINNE